MTKATKSQLLNAKELRTMLHVSERHLWRVKAAGKLPKSVRVGECVRWLQSDIEVWIELGCPSQRQFENRKAAKRKKK